MPGLNTRLPGETRYQQIAREQRERQAAREKTLKAKQRKIRKRYHPSAKESWKRNADHIDGYDRDDLGESPDY